MNIPDQLIPPKLIDNNTEYIKTDTPKRGGMIVSDNLMV